MKVTLTHDYNVAPDGHTTFNLKAGTEVEGTIAEMAVRDGKALAPAKELPKPKYTKPTAAKHRG
jgi:hypothetical protein